MTLEEVSSFIFSNYNNIVEIVKYRSYDLQRRGLPPEEIANESIISILDSEIEFNSEEEIFDYIKKAIKTNVIEETALSQDSNYIGSTFGKKISWNEARYQNVNTEQLTKVFDIFYKERFSIKEGRINCPRCGSVSVFNFYRKERKDTTTLGKCKICSLKISVTNRTGLADCKMSYQKRYKMIKNICDDPDVSTYVLARMVKATQDTSHYWRRLVVGAIIEAESRQIEDVLKVLLNPKLGKEYLLNINPIIRPVIPSKYEVLEALNCGGTAEKAAIILNKSRTVVNGYIKRYGIQKILKKFYVD